MTEPEQSYDPKLREALTKMQAIAKEYGCGYVIALANANFAEFKTDFPEWSLIQYQPGGIRLRLRSAEPQLTNDSLSVLLGLKDMSGMMYECLEIAHLQATKHVNNAYPKFRRSKLKYLAKTKS
ncbi:MAG: hypothetical protein V7L20_26145 [Nostoc sp.]|uniref:hypothetical protein n=1 Tax=Nostoc sp. TaxID=1180 RepID=UPI002FF77D1E